MLVTLVNCCTCYHCGKLMNSQRNSANKIDSCAVINYIILDTIFYLFAFWKLKAVLKKILNENPCIARRKFCRCEFIDVSKFIKQFLEIKISSLYTNISVFVFKILALHLSYIMLHTQFITVLFRSADHRKRIWVIFHIWYLLLIKSCLFTVILIYTCALYKRPSYLYL